MASAEPSAADSSQEPAPAVAASVGGPNPCCAKLWKKYQKLETSRTALREAVKLLQSENERLMKERSELNKVCKEERLRGDSAEAARETESDARDRLEKEIIELKEHNSALQQSQNVNKNDEPLRISELEEEIIRLKQVLGEERKKSNSEKKNAEEAKIKSLEMQKLLKMETHKSEECKRLSGTERKAANDLRASCEKLRSEANEAREMLAAQVKKTEEANKMAEEEKQKASKEKKRADSEKKLAEKNKNLIEAERKKVMEEKSRADCLFAKLEEQNKFNADLRVSIEAERKNVMNEKNHMNHLSQKLEEERKRSECLQRKFDDLCDTTSFGKHGQQHVDTVKEAANIKLLKEKLKLKKEQLKHVKNVSKLDEAKNALIRRELQCLKHDWMQLLSRFNMLDDHLGADGIEGIHVLTELKRHPEMHNFEQNLLHRNPVAAPYFGLQAGIGPFSSSTPRDYTSYRIPRESCTRPISGTSSELEPPIGSSARTKSKSQHRSSCPTSISDKKFMGSQGKDRPFVSTSTDIRKKQSSMVPELITKDSNGTKKQDNRALPVVPGDSFQLKALKPSQPGVKEIADKMLRVKKRKRTKVSPKSTTDLSSKHNLLHLEMKTHDATSNGISTFNDRRSCVQQGSSIMPVVTEDDLQNHRRKCHIIADKTPLFTVPTKVPSPAAGNAYAASKFASLLSFEEMIRGGCLKLLKLDNDADEKKYTRAMERPISPDLPVVPPANEPIYDKSHHLSGGTLNSLEYERDCPPSGADSMDLEMRPNLLGVEESAIRKEAQNSHKLGPLFNAIDFRDNVKQLCANDKYNSASNYSCNTKLDDASTKCSLSCLLHEDRPQNIVAFPADVAGNTSIPVFSQSSCSSHQNSTFHFQHFSKEASNENGPNQINGLSSDSGQQNTVRKCKAKAVGLTDVNSDSFIGLHRGNKNPPIHFVGIARMEKSDIIRIFRYWETVVAESREISKEASIDSPLFERISTEPLLRLEEKAALIVSLMLWDIHGFTTSDPVVDGNFASDFSLTLKSYMETRWIFLKSNLLDVTVSLIEDFLMEREVVVCNKMVHMIYEGSKHSQLDNETGIQVSNKSATLDQFISACALLALICVKVERMDIALEVSYKVLLMGKTNLSWTLLALHVFGSVCGDKLLFPKSCNFLLTSIRLVVLLLETTDNSLCLVSSYIQSNRPAAFPSCVHCPFDVDTVSIDGFIFSLLDELDLCSQRWNSDVNSSKIITSCNSLLGSSGLEINCAESCYISKQAKLSEDSHNYTAGRDLCYFAEIISLLELFGNYMSCEWTYNNVVVRLLKILESSTCEEYSAALLILISQLGRFFVDEVGYEQRAVNDLRIKLSVLLRTKFSNSRSIPVQLSATVALLSVLPLTFDKIVAHTGQLPDQYVLQARQVSDWFVQLSKEHQSLACSFFS